MRKQTMAVFVMLGAWACTSHKRPLPEVELPTSTPAEVFKFSDKAKQAKLTTVVLDVPIGHKYGELAWGQGGCHNKREVVNTEGRAELEVNKYADVFSTVMKKHGYTVEDQVELFKNSNERTADLRIGARLTEVTLNQCYPKWDEYRLKVVGSAAFKVEWSVYSTLEKKVVFVTTTKGTTYQEVESTLGETGLLRVALADAVERLANTSAYRAVIDPPEPTIRLVKGTRIKIKRGKEFSGDLKNHIDTIKRSVVTVTANKGSGSGFVISEDGLVVTAEHVVSGSKYVKVNTAAGKECYGEVVSSNKQRDLAIVQLDCAGVTALPIGQEKIVEGSEVFAIGTPLSEKLEFSVTKGVVSGVRKINDLDYIQSDVTILPGSSGGPLLDSHGNVVGVTTQYVAAGSVPVGISFFIPLKDIDKYLAVELE